MFLLTVNHRLLVILNFDVDVNPLIPDTVSSCDSHQAKARGNCGSWRLPNTNDWLKGSQDLSYA